MNNITLSLILISTHILLPATALANSDKYDSEFNKFIHLSGKWASGSIDCSKNSRGETFLFVRQEPNPSNINKNGPSPSATQKKSDLNWNVNKSEKNIFSYMKNGKVIYNRVPVKLYIADSSNAYLETNENKFRMNIQLTNPKMVPIRSGDLPKASKYTRTPVTEGEGFIVTAPDAVYIWENNNENAKLLCDITTETD